MDFKAAMRLLDDGRRVRRSLWDSAVYIDGTRMVWDITDKLARQCNENKTADRTYTSTPVDRQSSDWVEAA